MGEIVPYEDWIKKIKSKIENVFDYAIAQENECAAEIMERLMEESDLDQIEEMFELLEMVGNKQDFASLGMTAYEDKNFTVAEEAYRRAVNLSNSLDVKNNLAYLIRRKEVRDVNRYTLKSVADLLREGVLNKDAFSTVNMLLFLVFNVGTEECWEIADELMVNIEKHMSLDVAEWWKQVAENGEAEGYLVHLMLIRHGKIKESSLGGKDFLLARVREQYSNIPSYMNEILTPYEDLEGVE